jgi:hypothetical protein
MPLDDTVIRRYFGDDPDPERLLAKLERIVFSLYADFGCYCNTCTKKVVVPDGNEGKILSPTDTLIFSLFSLADQLAKAGWPQQHAELLMETIKKYLDEIEK